MPTGSAGGPTAGGGRSTPLSATRPPNAPVPPAATISPRRPLPAAIPPDIRESGSTPCPVATPPIRPSGAAPAPRPGGRHHAEDAQSGTDALVGGDRADRPCGGGTPADTHAKVDASAARLRSEPHIGRDPVEVQGTATVNRDRDLGLEIGEARRRCDRAAQLRGQHAGIEKLLAIETRKGIAQDRRALVNRKVDATDHCSQPFDRAIREAAELNASARRDLDDAVAAIARRRAQSDERLGTDRCAGGREPHEKTVTRWHGLRETGTSPAAEGSVHGAPGFMSAAKPASISLRRGCQSPRRRAVSRRAAIAAAAAGFSRTIKSRTTSSAT